MNRYAYYPGCSLETMACEYDASFRNVCAHLGISLEEVRDWFCCGAGMVGNLSPLLGLATPMKNLALAHQSGFDQLVAPCSACYNQFKRATLVERWRDGRLPDPRRKGWLRPFLW